MKKKDLLITIVLAVLITSSTPFFFQCEFVWKAYRQFPSLSKCKLNLAPKLPGFLSIGGFPLPFWGTSFPFFGIGTVFFVACFLTWFLLLAAGWRTINKIKERFKLNNSGFALIELLIVLAVLIIIAGGLVVLPVGRRVWEKKVSTKLISRPTPTPTPRISPIPTPIQGIPISCKTNADCPDPKQCYKCIEGVCQYLLGCHPEEVVWCQNDADCSPLWRCINNRCVRGDNQQLLNCLEQAENARRRVCEEQGVSLDEFGNCPLGIDFVIDPVQECYEKYGQK